MFLQIPITHTSHELRVTLTAFRLLLQNILDLQHFGFYVRFKSSMLILKSYQSFTRLYCQVFQIPFNCFMTKQYAAKLCSVVRSTVVMSD